jgi:hypothetical protein
MLAITDPALELADIAKRLSKATSKIGEKFLQEEFGVEAWSTDFLKIITCIFERVDLINAVVQRSNLDPDAKLSATADLENFKRGFAGDSLRASWQSGGLAAMKDHGRPIQYMSASVKDEISYPKLTSEEVAEFLTLIDTYLAEVKNSDVGPDFVRRSVIDGLTAFRFQLEKIGWMGAGYALMAFRQVVFIYEAADSHFRQTNPDAEAFLGGFLTILKKFKKTVDDAKGWADAGKAVYNAYSLSAQAVAPLLITGQLLGNH